MESRHYIFGGVTILVIVVSFFFFYRQWMPNSVQPVPVETTETTSVPVPLKGEVVLGAVMPLTGDGSAYGLPIMRSIELAVDEVNGSGGIDGRKVVVRYEDGECDGPAAKRAATKLITVDGVEAILGGVCSSEVLGMAEMANASKTVLLSPSATSPSISEQGGDYTFRLVPSDAFASVVAARFAFNDLHIRRIAVFAERTEYAQGLKNGFINGFNSEGGEVALEGGWDTGTTDFRNAAMKIKEAGIDAVYLLPQAPAAGLDFLQALQDAHVRVRILTNEVMLGREVAASHPGLLEGVYGFEAFYNETGDSASKFLSMYESREHEKAPFPFYMANAYSSIYLLKDLIEEQGNDGTRLRTAFLALKHWKGGALNDLTFTDQGDILWSTYQVKLVRGGEITEDKLVTY